MASGLRPGDVGEKSEVACSFEGDGKTALMPGAGTRLTAAEYLPALRQIAAQAPYVFVVDNYLFRAKLAYAVASGAAEASDRAPARSLRPTAIRSARRIARRGPALSGLRLLCQFLTPVESGLKPPLDWLLKMADRPDRPLRRTAASLEPCRSVPLGRAPEVATR